MGIMKFIPKVLDPVPGGKSMVNAVDFIVNWARSNSLWPLTYGTSCCAIEMMATSMSRYDISRFGSEVFRASPRQADLIILAGTIVEKMAEPLVTLYEQMPGPKYVIAMGACAVSGGPFYYDNYSVVKGADRLIPVDVYIPGCPPRPEALLQGLMLLQEKIKKETLRNPWTEEDINTSPITNPFGDALQAWKHSETRKDEEQADARAKFKEENPDYQGYKHVRVKREVFPEVPLAEIPAKGLTKAQLFTAISKKFDQVGVHGLEEISPEAIEEHNPLEALNLTVPKTDYYDLINFLKSEAGLDFDYLFDMLSIDWKENFEMVVQMQSLRHKHKIIIRTILEKDEDAAADEVQAKLPTLSRVFRAAEWKEREIYDMMGISFEGHPDLRRLFLDDDFVGFPLRKDFTSDAMIPRGY
ncbi:MAG: NADH-quinone oxidoreductase subunit NuoB [Fibrobacter sp.]|nr:NADH-quinone oxidoreductase subunit NuoB [Fibrobacter sp.]